MSFPQIIGFKTVKKQWLKTFFINFIILQRWSFKSYSNNLPLWHWCETKTCQLNQADQPSYHNFNISKSKLVVISYLLLCIISLSFLIQTNYSNLSSWFLVLFPFLLYLSLYNFIFLYTFDNVYFLFLPLTNQFLVSLP